MELGITEDGVVAPETSTGEDKGADNEAIASEVVKQLMEQSATEEPTAEEVESQQNFETLQQDYMLVVCEYLPKLYVSSLFIIGGMAFALVAYILKKFTSHFV